MLPFPSAGDHLESPALCSFMLPETVTRVQATRGGSIATALAGLGTIPSPSLSSHGSTGAPEGRTS